MSPAPLTCPKCKAVLKGIELNQPEFQKCWRCGAGLQVEVFPALIRPMATGRDGDLVVMEGESTCFYHPAKKAVRPCEGCGRFVCALCDCELHGQHFCPACLEVGRSKGKIKSLENQRTLYDSIALSLAIVPLLAWPITFITAPAAIFIAIRHWNSPRGLIHRTKIRHVVAIIFATMEIAGWITVLYFVVNRNVHVAATDNGVTVTTTTITKTVTH